MLRVLKSKEEFKSKVAFYEKVVCVTMPKKFGGKRFSAHHDGKSFYLSEDQAGNLCSQNGKKGHITFGHKHFKAPPARRVPTTFDVQGSDGVYEFLDFKIPERMEVAKPKPTVSKGVKDEVAALKQALDTANRLATKIGAEKSTENGEWCATLRI